MSFETESSLTLNDIPLNIQRNAKVNRFGNKSSNIKAVMKKVAKEGMDHPKMNNTNNIKDCTENRTNGTSLECVNGRLAAVEETVDNNSQSADEDDENDDNHDHDNVHSKKDKQYVASNQQSSITDSRGSSSTDTTSDGSDVVNLSSSKHSVHQSNTMKSEKQTALFIGDLPGNVTEQMLTDIFSKYKSFNSVKICVDSNNKQSLGYGYLNFGDQADADKAVDAYNYMPMFGREIRMMPSLRNTYFRKNIGTNVFFSNLPLDNSKLTTRVFYDEFKKFGKILSCKLDRRKNIGFIYFENDAAAKEAIKEYNGKTFFDTNIMCGVHFDRNVRKSPEFEQKIGRINNLTVVKEKLEVEDKNGYIIEVDAVDSNSPDKINGISTQDSVSGVVNSSSSVAKLPHPNAIFVKNLPINPNHDNLLTFFSKIGPVKSVYTSDVSKFDSSWAFITYKRIQDTKVAIEKLNGTKYLKRTIEVKKAERQHLEENQIESNTKPNNYKKTVYLTNLSVICNEEFLNFFCDQERIKTERIIVKYYDEKTDTYSGYVRCSSRNDAQRLFDLMENKLLGDSEVKASWQLPKDVKLVELDPSFRLGKNVGNTDVSHFNHPNHFNPKKNRYPRQGYVYRAPAPNYRPSKNVRNYGASLQSSPLVQTGKASSSIQASSQQRSQYLPPHQHPYHMPFPNPYHLHYGNGYAHSQQQHEHGLLAANSNVLIGSSNTTNAKKVPHAEESRKPYSYEAKKQLMSMLKKETKRCIDFLQHPSATREENISTIASYILDVYYKPNYDTLAQLLLLKNGNNYYERVFQNQVELAIEKLGLQER